MGGPGGSRTPRIPPRLRHWVQTSRPLQGHETRVYSRITSASQTSCFISGCMSNHSTKWLGGRVWLFTETSCCCCRAESSRCKGLRIKWMCDRCATTIAGLWHIAQRLVWRTSYGAPYFTFFTFLRATFALEEWGCIFQSTHHYNWTKTDINISTSQVTESDQIISISAQWIMPLSRVSKVS
jgi:hypothetical protein